MTEKDDEKFHGKVESASELLKTNAKIYENEEWALRTLREEEAQEMNRVEKEKRKKRKENREWFLLFIFVLWLSLMDSDKDKENSGV